MSLRERTTGNMTVGTLVSDVTNIDLNDMAAADTMTLTPTRVDTATANTTTGTITWDTNTAGTAAAAQTAIRALGGIYATATCVAGAGTNITITVLGGYDITWAVASPSGFTPGAVVETTPGSSAYQVALPVGKYSTVYRVYVKGGSSGVNDKSADLSVVDSTAKDVIVKTAIDLSSANYDKFLSNDGVEASDGASSSDGPLLAEGPLTAKLTLSAPTNTAAKITLFCGANEPGGGYRKRHTGAITGSSGTVTLGAQVGIVRRIKLLSSSDTSVAPTITDALGKSVYTKSSTNYTTAVDQTLAGDGVDQAGNTLADVVPVVAKSPLTVALSGLGAGTFTVTVWVEV